MFVKTTPHVIEHYQSETANGKNFVETLLPYFMMAIGAVGIYLILA
jgi:hypothetical protein